MIFLTVQFDTMGKDPLAGEVVDVEEWCDVSIDTLCDISCGITFVACNTCDIAFFAFIGWEIAFVASIAYMHLCNTKLKIYSCMSV